MRFGSILALGACLSLAACATAGAGGEIATPTNGAAAYASSYRAPASGPTLLRGATVLDGLGGEFAGTDVLIVDGRISAVGQNLAAPAGADVV
ncbi:MAG TPA: hypothetical protein PLS69_07940, partial [Terricaulis sp.]|nr:hypothetical protein [Terricaulis sp.]